MADHYICRVVHMGRSGGKNAPLRYAEFDGLRGLAAFMVFVHHAILMLNPGPIVDSFNALPLSLLWDGVAAVDLFFVLSGFVLALPFVGGSDRRPSYLPFVVRRAFRIYPAYWFAILMALFLRFTIFDPDGVEDLSYWANLVWDESPANFFGHVFLIAFWADDSLLHTVTDATTDMYGLNPVLWSLVIEMRMSLIFPFVIFAIRVMDTKLSSLLLLLLTFLVAGMFTVLWALPLFLIGGLIAHYREDIGKIIGKLHAPLIIALWVGGLIFFNARYAVPGYHPHGVLAHYLSGLGAALIVALVVGGSGLKVMTSRPARFLGKISYGFYLIHLPVLLAVTSVVCGWLGSGTVGLVTAFAASCLITIGLSMFVYRFVEAPGQNLGRAMSRELIARAAARRAATTEPATRGGPPTD